MRVWSAALHAPIPWEALPTAQVALLAVMFTIQLTPYLSSS